MKTSIKAMALSIVALLAGCQDDAKVANHNLSKAADNFEIMRRVVFINGITDKYLLSIEGRCSVETSASGHVLHVICKTGNSEFKKHMLGLSDNVSFMVEQMESVKASAYHYRITFKPQQILPDIDFRGSSRALTDALTPDKSD
jgi:hypothetical protein